MSMTIERKILSLLENYFDRRTADIQGFAYRMTTLPDSVQEAIWEWVINYIQCTADRDEGWTPMMKVYIQQARDIRDNL